MKKFFVGFLVVLGVYLYFQGKSEGMDKLVNGTSYVDSEEAKQMKQIIIEEAKKVNLPEWIPLAIAEHESRLNPRSVGDNGTVLANALSSNNTNPLIVQHETSYYVATPNLFDWMSHYVGEMLFS